MTALLLPPLPPPLPSLASFAAELGLPDARTRARLPTPLAFLPAGPVLPPPAAFLPPLAFLARVPPGAFLPPLASCAPVAVLPRAALALLPLEG